MKNKPFLIIICLAALLTTISLKNKNASSLNQIHNPFSKNESTSSRKDKNIHPEKKLSLDEVSQLALENSLDIQIAKFDTYRARTSLKNAESIFDTFLNAETSYRNNSKRSSTTLQDAQTVTDIYSIGFEKKLPEGSTLKINMKDSRVSSNLSTTVLKPYHEAVAEVSLTQSLGKNFFGLADRAGIKTTKIDIINAEYTSLTEIENILYNAQAAYWILTFRNEELKIKSEMLEEAKKLLNIYKDKYERGLAEAVDLLAAQSNVGSREDDVLSSQLEKEIAKNDLLFLLNEEDTSVDIEPSDSLDITPHNVDMYQELKEALLNRRDYKIITNQLKSLNIDIAVKKNSLWPEIDLEASFVKNGIKSTLQDSWKDISSENNSEVYVGVSFKMPVENRLSKSELKEAQLHKEQLLLSLKRTERLILKEIHNKTQKVNNLKSRLTLLDAIVELQKNKLIEEMKRLRSGRSDSDTIIRYENDLLQARLNLASTLLNYHISLIELDTAKNTLLNKYWIGKL